MYFYNQLFNISRNEEIERLFRRQLFTWLNENVNILLQYQNSYNWLDIFSPNAKNIMEAFRKLKDIFKVDPTFLQHIKIHNFSDCNKSIKKDIEKTKEKDKLQEIMIYRNPHYRELSEIDTKFHFISMISKFHLIKIDKLFSFLKTLTSLLNLDYPNSMIYISDYTLFKLDNLEDLDKDYINFQRNIGAVFFPFEIIAKIVRQIHVFFELEFYYPETNNDTFWSIATDSSRIKKSLFLKGKENELHKRKNEFNKVLKNILGYDRKNEEAYLATLVAKVRKTKSDLKEEYDEQYYEETLDNFLSDREETIEGIRDLQAICWRVHSQVMNI